MHYLILFLSLFFFSCGWSTREAATADDSTASGSAATPANLTGLGFYRKYTGTIAGKPVTAHLKVVGERLSGTYYYDEIGIPIRLWPAGYDEVADRHKAFELAGDQSQSWSVTIDENGATGRWEAQDTQHMIELQVAAGSNLSVWSRADSLRARPNFAEPRALISYELLLLPRVANAFEHAIFEMLLGKDRGDKDPESAWLMEKDNYFQDYRKTIAELSDSEVAGHYFLNYEAANYADVYFDNDGLLSVGVLTYAYSGGAHGMSCTSFLNFDQYSNKALKLSDMIRVDSNVLNQIIEVSARNHFQIPTEVPLKDRLFVDEMHVSDHYFITQKGITFNYCPYAIASYAEGEIQLFVPWQELRQLLHPAFARRLGL